MDRAFTDEHVRDGISSMQSSQFGRARVPMQQSRIDGTSFRQASMMTGANPVSPSRQSFQSVDRQANPGSIPNRAAGSERFFGSSARQNSSFQAGRGTNSISRGPSYGASSRPSQSSAPAWRTFSPSTGRGMQSNSGGVYERQGTPQGRPNDPQSSQSSRDYRPNTRGGSNGSGVTGQAGQRSICSSQS